MDPSTKSNQYSRNVQSSYSWPHYHPLMYGEARVEPESPPNSENRTAQCGAWPAGRSTHQQYMIDLATKVGQLSNYKNGNDIAWFRNASPQADNLKRVKYNACLVAMALKPYLEYIIDANFNSFRFSDEGQRNTATRIPYLILVTSSML
ncbi:hypothetical protein OUZ56_011195 [Daphnia magna]|uniref:Uncharacterized protein n=1 Tax=Daphnia magna TaxID=35525 RepID=A0ABQ9YZN1_9CRUS|nr:hypothetical protein OUZ56_011195 [Daphnia magna]